MKKYDELNKSLMHAIENRNYGEIPNIIKSGANVNAEYKEDGSPLHLASHLGDVKTIRTLIALGADVNARNEDGNTPLHLASHIASQPDQTLAIETLIELGADINARNKLGKTPSQVFNEQLKAQDTSGSATSSDDENTSDASNKRPHNSPRSPTSEPNKSLRGAR